MLNHFPFPIEIPPENGLGWRGLSVGLRNEQPDKKEKDDHANDGPNQYRLVILSLDFLFVGEVNGIFAVQRGRLSPSPIKVPCFS